MDDKTKETVEFLIGGGVVVSLVIWVRSLIGKIFGFGGDMRSWLEWREQVSADLKRIKDGFREPEFFETTERRLCKIEHTQTRRDEQMKEMQARLAEIQEAIERLRDWMYDSRPGGRRKSDPRI
jgi:hypothetical protein